MRIFACLMLILGLVGLSACSDYDPRKMPEGSEEKKAKMGFQENIDHYLKAEDLDVKKVEVSHILIKKEHKGKSQEASKKFAEEIYNKIMAGEDFETLKEKNSEDPGSAGKGKTYVLHDKGSTPGSGEHQRSGMVKYFGDVSFRLEVGEVGVAPYDAKNSGHGWHIIKRVK